MAFSEQNLTASPVMACIYISEVTGPCQYDEFCIGISRTISSLPGEILDKEILMIYFIYMIKKILSIKGD